MDTRRTTTRLPQGIHQVAEQLGLAEWGHAPFALIDRQIRLALGSRKTRAVAQGRQGARWHSPRAQRSGGRLEESGGGVRRLTCVRGDGQIYAQGLLICLFDDFPVRVLSDDFSVLPERIEVTPLNLHLDTLRGRPSQ
jgi:hypothetical protein